MGGRGGGSSRAAAQPATTQAPAAAPVAAPAANAPLERRILDLVAQFESSPNGPVSLVRIRGSLPDVERSALDAELKRLDRARAIQLDVDPNIKAIPQAGRDAAIQFGGQARHLIRRI